MGLGSEGRRYIWEANMCMHSALVNYGLEARDIRMPVPIC